MVVDHWVEWSEFDSLEPVQGCLNLIKQHWHAGCLEGSMDLDQEHSKLQEQVASPDHTPCPLKSQSHCSGTHHFMVNSWLVYSLDKWQFPCDCDSRLRLWWYCPSCLQQSKGYDHTQLHVLILKMVTAHQGRCCKVSHMPCCEHELSFWASVRSCICGRSQLQGQCDRLVVACCEQAIPAIVQQEQHHWLHGA